VCDGVCIRFMPESIYSACKEYDDPEMLFAPLDKLLLQVKFAGMLITST
jgi:HrpA-like RNA helicase